MPGLRAYPSAALSGSTGSPEEPLGRHWPLRNHRCVGFLPGGAPKLGGDPVCGMTRRIAAGRSADQLLKSFGIECSQTDTKSGKGAHITADQHHQPTASSAKAPPSRGFLMCREPAVRGGVHGPPDPVPSPETGTQKYSAR